MVDIDSETLFNGAAALLATVAVSVFVLNVELGLSPVTKVALTAAFLAGVFALTQRTADRQLTLFGYGVVVASGVALFFDVVNTFDADDAVTALGLLAFAALLFWARTRLNDENRFVTGRTATYAAGAFAVLAVVILVTDVVTGGLAYELRPGSEVTVPDSRDDEIRLGTVTATNPTPLPERVETPNYGVCAAGNWSEFRRPTEPGERERPVRANLNVQDGYNEHVWSFGSRTFPVTLYLDGANLTGETFPVRSTSSCPDTETGAPFLAVYESSDDRRYVRPL